ncbi:FtsW/RodA/SpoVE family cell cycle protein [Schleiferilactobacillus perolens]|jgi:cell division protein FtsW|uniref:Probable peptidoglycan glycosyltransferase FtsW n=1 Tax=Schleiferilactobacillus perolens DSM 12744 TaxID=1423792 RepID=A0A0R1N8J6_9LACO|nr:FtsW/RodA/SpoVE family cell cycle protein [Schleiferilactobacillus perolens]KRL14181.1 cell cycle family protein [Schleiferilactobacillus perolens DSM 12744]MCI1892284.1 FtsW/RodA/SpoVE family cell cycle protein [Schleiferilactobacillus harbinensis]MCI1913190.1 FtsW/RodA/SpoVE family cell cycle protein [Schleiferilactobacillus harbinensis]MCI2171266.1 FtsW/RodA/SpoVE family cell cycle protein [Schleiferilactobacillus perolens]
MRTRLKHIDYLILIPYLLLIGVGIVMVYSASSDNLTVQGLPATMYLKRQAIFAVIGIFLAAFSFFIALRVVEDGRLTRLAVLVTLLLLAILVVMRYLRPSMAINGSVAWFKVGPVNVQPVEIAKLVLILYLARILSRREEKLTELRTALHQLTAPMIVAGLMAVLVLWEPDVGGTAILLTLTIIMLAASGIRWYYSTSFVGFVLLCIVGMLSFLRTAHLPWIEDSYQFKRLLAFFTPFKLENSGGRQLVNSYYAISNGGFFGVGLGNSIQKKGYLPEPYTDFIMSITTEELGIIGAIIILSILTFLICRIILVGVRSRSAYRSLLCYGIGAWLFIQTVFNIGGMLGILPLTGVTLPFISYGGSSTMMLSIGVGLVMNVSSMEQIEKERAWASATA